MTDIEDILFNGRVVGIRIVHPPGVECDFESGQCSCGALGLGLTRDEDPIAENNLDAFAEKWRGSTDGE